MKTLFYSLLFCTFLVNPAWADSHENARAKEDHGIKVTIDMDDENDTDNKISEKELENKIKGKVFSIISDIIDAAEDDISEDEKDEIKKEIKEAIQDIKGGKDNSNGHNISISSDGGSMFDDGLTLLEALIPLTAIVVVFGTPIMIVGAVLYTSYRKKRLMHDTIDQYVSSGKDIPEEVLQGLQKQVTPKNNLHKGLVMVGIGLGIFLCFMIIGSTEAAALGLIPLFIGLAQLLIWKLESK
jgi:uncharacterized protein DUF6249